METLNYLNNGHGLASWLLTKDHKRIAILYLLSITAFFGIGGFFAMLQYGVFFPLGGLGYLPSQTINTPISGGWDLSAAQTVRWFVGVVY